MKTPKIAELVEALEAIANHEDGSIWAPNLPENQLTVLRYLELVYEPMDEPEYLRLTDEGEALVQMAADAESAHRERAAH